MKHLFSRDSPERRITVKSSILSQSPIPTVPSPKKKGPKLLSELGALKSGDVLLSHRVTPAVPSAQEGLTSEFGMGSGVAPPQ